MQTCNVTAAVTLSSLHKSLIISCETSLPFFLFRFKADGKNCGPGPRQLKVRLNSQIYLVCPNLPTVLQQRGHDVQTSNMKENIWLLHNKTAFDECDVSQVQVTQKTDFFICDDPTRLVFLSLLFLEKAHGMNDRTFVGGRTYYLIGKEK